MRKREGQTFSVHRKRAWGANECRDWRVARCAMTVVVIATSKPAPGTDLRAGKEAGAASPSASMARVMESPRDSELLSMTNGRSMDSVGLSPSGYGPFGRLSSTFCTPASMSRNSGLGR